MKRIVCLVLTFLLACVPAAMAQRLEMQVNEYVSVDAELPEDLPKQVSELKVEYRAFDVDAVRDLLMPAGERGAEDQKDKDEFRYFGEAGSDYMLAGNGRVAFETDYYYKQLLGVLRIEDEMDDYSIFYPEDAQVEGLDRAEAIAQAQKALDFFGIAIPTDAKVYAVERNSFAKMQAVLKQSDYQASIHRRNLEPLDTQHEGYFISFYDRIEGLPYINVSHVGALVTRQGIEYLETSQTFDVVKRSKPKKILSPERALKKAAKELKKLGAHYNVDTGETTYAPVTIERITLCYTLDFDKMVLHPLYLFDYEYEMSQGTGSWRTRTFDNRPHIKTVYIDPYTGKVRKDMDFDD